MWAEPSEGPLDALRGAYLELEGALEEVV
jgi:hypothetical protein